jgi:hypothetical protein
MSEETLSEGITEPVPEATVDSPALVNETPVEPEPSKTFTQEEMDERVQKRLIIERRKWERSLKESAPPPIDLPPVDQFESPDAYAEAKVLKLMEQRELQKQQSQILEAYHNREQEALDKYDDFEQVAYNPKLSITTVMAQSIQASDVGPEVAYYLGANPKEADRIARLDPVLQAKEIGRIEAKLSSDPPVKRTSSAPAPIRPVTARTSGNPSYDTTDPRSTKAMTTSEWIEAERIRQIKKWEALRM